METKKVFTLSLFFLCFSLLVPNNKYFFVFSFGYLIVLLLITKSIEKAFFYGYVVISQFSVGQLYVYNVIPAEVLNHPLYPAGRDLYFRFTPALALSMAMAGVMIMQIIKYRRFRVPIIGLMIMLFYLVGLISSINGKVLPNLSVIYSLGSMATLVWFIMGNNLLEGISNQREKIFVFKIALVLIMLVGIFQGLLVIGQQIKRSTLGLVIEQTTMLPSFGTGGDENPWMIRPVGLSTHANLMAFDFVSLIGIVLISMSFYNMRNPGVDKKLKLLSIVFFILSVLSIILSQSRASYVALIILLVGSWKITKKSININLIKKMFTFIGKYKVSFLIVEIILVFIVTDRMLHTLYSFGISGGMGVRDLLVGVANNLIGHHLWFGVGQGMFIPAAFSDDPTGVMMVFPESVHNGFLLLLAEQGLVSVMAAIISIYFITRTVLLRNIFSSINLIMVLVMISGYVVMWLHPICAIIPGAVFWWLLGTKVYEKDNV